MSNRKHLIIVRASSEEASKKYFVVVVGNFNHEDTPEKATTLNIPTLGLEGTYTNYVVDGHNFVDYPEAAVLFYCNNDLLALVEKATELEGLTIEVGRHDLTQEEEEELQRQYPGKVTMFGDRIPN